MTTDPLDEDRLIAEGRALRALARNLLGPAAHGVTDADDLLQSSHLAALQGGGVAGRTTHWFAGTLRNLARMVHRHTRRRQRREQTRLPAPDASDPAAIAMQAELLRDVAAAVQRLDEPFRTAVVLRYWQDLPPTAIAERLAVPLDTVRSRLQRGLTRLRRQLDARHGSREAWATPLLLLTDGREAAGVGGTIVGVGSGVAILGVTMQTKILVGVAVVVVAAVIWRSGSIGAMPMPTQRGAGASLPIAVLDPSAEPGAAPRLERETVAHGAATSLPAQATPTDESSAAAAPWTAEFFVCDTQERPVAEATITIWQLAAEDASTWQMEERHSADPEPVMPVTVRTDTSGRGSTVLGLGIYEVHAEKAAVGRCDNVVLTPKRPTDVTRIVLLPALAVHGCVLAANGLPLADAQVAATGRARLPQRRSHVRPGPAVRTDAAGRFTFPVERWASYEFVASTGVDRSFPERVIVELDQPPELTLVFPGAASLSGLVVDAEGAPVEGAEVTAWRERIERQGAGRDAGETPTGRTDAAGRFRLPVRRHARYQVLAAAPGAATSELQWLETSAARPHPEVRLALQRFRTIRGRVLYEDGSPLPTLKVLAKPEAGLSLHGDHDVEKQAMPLRVDRFPKVPAATTDDDGSFALQVHPGTTWTLSARLLANDWRMAVHRSNVAAGSDEVVLWVTGTDLAGCVVHGTVTAAEPSPEGYQVTILDCRPDGTPTTSSRADVSWQEQRFTCQPLPRGQQFLLRVEPAASSRSSLAPAHVGPFRTDAPDLTFAMHLERKGTVQVRVCLLDDTPAHQVMVDVSAKSPMQRATSVTFEGDAPHTLQLPSGTYTLQVRSAEGQPVHQQDVVVMPGPNPEVVLRLPH